jgi:hypothetical protein
MRTIKICVIFQQGAIDYDIAIANLSDRSISDDRLGVLFSSLPLHTIILLEDIDAAFSSREDESKSKFLNCLRSLLILKLVSCLRPDKIRGHESAYIEWIA